MNRAEWLERRRGTEGMEDDDIRSCECDECPQYRGRSCDQVAESGSDVCVDCSTGDHPEADTDDPE